MVGLGWLQVLFARWVISETPPDPYLLGVATWLTTGVAIVPRALEGIKRYGREQE